MKKLVFSLMLGTIVVWNFAACTTAHDAASDAGHATGHVLSKTGRVLQHGGEEVEEHTP